MDEFDSGACPAARQYVEVEVEGYFEGVRSERNPSRLDPEPWWRRWFAAVFSLENPYYEEDRP